MAKQQDTGYYVIAIFGAILLWLLTRGQSLVSASVTSMIGAPVQNGVIAPDQYGNPQFNSQVPATFNAAAYAAAVNPICAGGVITAGPADPSTCSCPQGYTLWHDIGGGAYVCMQT